MPFEGVILKPGDIEVVNLFTSKPKVMKKILEKAEQFSAEQVDHSDHGIRTKIKRACERLHQWAIGQGAEDAKKNLPDTHGPYHSEQALKSKHENIYQEELSPVQSKIRALDDDISNYRQQLATTEVFQTCKSIGDHCDRHVKEIEEEISEHDTTIERIEHNFDLVKSKIGRDTGLTKGSAFFMRYRFLAIAILVVLAIADIPFTYAAYESLLMSKLHTKLIVLLIILAILFLTEFGGYHLKRYKEAPHHKTWFYAILFTTIGFLFFTSGLRYENAIANVVMDTLTHTQYGDFTDVDPLLEDISAKPVFNLNSLRDPLYWNFFWPNFIILFIGFAFSFKVHEPNDEFEKAFKQFHFHIPNLKRQIKKLKASKEQQVNSKESRIKSAKSKIPDLIKEKIQEFEALVKVRNKLGNTHNNLARKIANHFIESTNTYRAHNEKNRSTPIPATWIHVPTIELPHIEKADNNILNF